MWVQIFSYILKYCQSCRKLSNSLGCTPSRDSRIVKLVVYLTLEIRAMFQSNYGNVSLLVYFLCGKLYLVQTFVFLWPWPKQIYDRSLFKVFPRQINCRTKWKGPLITDNGSAKKVFMPWNSKDEASLSNWKIRSLPRESTCRLAYKYWELIQCNVL